MIKYNLLQGGILVLEPSTMGKKIWRRPKERMKKMIFFLLIIILIAMFRLFLYMSYEELCSVVFVRLFLLCLIVMLMQITDGRTDSLTHSRTNSEESNTHQFRLLGKKKKDGMARGGGVWKKSRLKGMRRRRRTVSFLTEILRKRLLDPTPTPSFTPRPIHRW